MSKSRRGYDMWTSSRGLDSMFPNSSPGFQDTQTESNNFRPSLEGIDSAFEQPREVDIDMYHKGFLYTDFECVLMMEQLRQAIEVIENVCKVSSTVWVNRQQCKQMADSFSAIGEALKGLRRDRKLVRSEPSDGGSNKKYPALDDLLTVLRKGERLVSYCNTWKGMGSYFSWINSQEAMFKEIHEELDIMKEKFDFEGFINVGQEKDFESTSGLGRTPVSCVAIEKADENWVDEDCDRFVARIWKSEQTSQVVDMVKLDITSQVAEGMYDVKRATVDFILVRTDSGEGCKLSTWKGVPYCAAFRMLQQSYNKLSRHPHTEGLSVGCNEQGSLVMDCLSAINLKELIKSEMWRTVPVSKECATMPLNFYCDILLQTGMGMTCLQSKEVQRDLKAANVLVNKHSGPSIVFAKLVDFGLSKVHGVYEGAGTNFWREGELLLACHKMDVYSFGIVASEVLTGSVRKTTLRKILYSEEEEKFLKHLCDEDWREERDKFLQHLCDEDLRVFGDVNSYLHKKPLLSTVFLGLIDDVGTESNLEALEVSAFKNEGSGSEASLVYQNSSKPVEDDAAQSSAKEFSPTNAVGSYVPGTTSTSPSFGQQDSTEICSRQQMPEILNDGEPARKRNRTRIWSDDEKLALLKLSKEAPRMDVGPDWDYVSDNLWEEYDFDRASNSCQQQWFTLLRSYRAIQDHESKIQSGMNDCVSYWDMSEVERSSKKLQHRFDFEWCKMIERTVSIFQIQDSDLPSSTLPLCQSHSCVFHKDHCSSANCNEVTDDESTDEESEEIDIQSENGGCSVDSSATLESQAEAAADSDVPQKDQSLEPCNESNSEYHMKEEERTNSLCETNSKYAGRMRSGKDDLISRITPFVNKQVEDALKPHIAILRSREEGEQKHREEMLAIKEQKLALKREKMQFTRHALGNSYDLLKPAFTSSSADVQTTSKTSFF